MFCGNEENRKTALLRRRLPGLWMLIVPLLAIVLYLNTLGNGFVYDDIPQVVQNPWIRGFHHVWAIFTSGAWGFGGESTNYYRPLMHIFYMLLYFFFGLNPLGFHVFNICVHAGVSLLVFSLASGLLHDDRPLLSPPVLSASVTAGLLFAAHPIHTEAVSWISGIPDLSFTFFCLGSLLLYMRLPAERMPSSDPSYLLSVLLFSLATLCKETALVFPFVFIAYDHFIREDRRALRRRICGYLPFLTVAAVYFLLRVHALGGLAPQKRHTELTTHQYLVSALPLLRDYVLKLILPLNLSVFYTFHPASSVLQAPVLSALIFILVLLVLLFRLHKANKRAFFLFLLMLIPLLPVMYIPALGENPFAERYLYLPSVGFVLLLSLAVQYANRTRPKSSLVITISVCLVIALYSSGVVARNPAWKNDRTLWEDAVTKSPDAAIARYNLGLILYQEGYLDRAIQQYQAALRLQPSPKVYNDLAVAYNDVGLSDRAIGLLQIAVRMSPEFADAHNNLGVAYISKRLYRKAIEHLKIAAALNPSFSGTYSNLGLSYEGLGMRDDAITNYEIALRLDANNSTARKNLAILLSGGGK
jgi:tetratricopeptide (TPR) repeat protein